MLAEQPEVSPLTANFPAGNFCVSVGAVHGRGDERLEKICPAAIIDHPSNLCVLYSLNAHGIVGFDLVTAVVRKVVNFHQGKLYLEHVAFEKPYSTDVHIAVPK